MTVIFSLSDRSENTGQEECVDNMYIYCRENSQRTGTVCVYFQKFCGDTKNVYVEPWSASFAVRRWCGGERCRVAVPRDRLSS